MPRAARKVLEFRGTLKAFLEDEKTQSAVLHKLLLMGEAAKRISPAFTARHPPVLWRLIVGMRDRLIHAYDAVDMEEVWVAVDRDLSRLLKKLEPLLPQGGP